MQVSIYKSKAYINLSEWPRFIEPRITYLSAIMNGKTEYFEALCIISY